MTEQIHKVSSNFNLLTDGVTLSAPVHNFLPDESTMSVPAPDFLTDE